MTPFEKIWQRIKESTPLKTLKDLEKCVEKSKSTVAKKKAKGEFPVEWAYLIADKYQILTEWLITGVGPEEYNEKYRYEIIEKIERWIYEYSIEEKEFSSWFTIEFKKRFPEFKEWEKKKNESSG